MSWLFVNIAVYTVFAFGGMFGGPVSYPTAVYTRSMTGVFISLRLLLYMAVYTVLQPEVLILLGASRVKKVLPVLVQL